jgi:Flp pilus assembly CpaF family ATPase
MPTLACISASYNPFQDACQLSRLGDPLKKIGTMSASSADAAFRTLASYHHTTVTRENPCIECELPLDGSRFAGHIPPLVSSPVFAVRKRASRVFTLEQYVEAGIITPEQKEFLCEAVKNHRNVLITGSTGSGKEHPLNGIIHELTDQFPNERLVIIEDTAESSAKDYVQYTRAQNVRWRSWYGCRFGCGRTEYL